MAFDLELEFNWHTYHPSLSVLLYSSHFDGELNQNYYYSTHSFRRARIVKNQSHEQCYTERCRWPVRSHGTAAAGAVSRRSSILICDWSMCNPIVIYKIKISKQKTPWLLYPVRGYWDTHWGKTCELIIITILASHGFGIIVR